MHSMSKTACHFAYVICKMMISKADLSNNEHKYEYHIFTIVHHLYNNILIVH